MARGGRKDKEEVADKEKEGRKMRNKGGAGGG